ncbi:hypothetical protein B7P43_G05747 [Cryptotermes secundus]|uniref:Secreted protein n=1 Tax=Cryptotermes secundus TaxID=105785 RepID=A0A2J7QTZ1_9NEOP|nr:hypothetical protein B7P43_G05747 [Cryptotermes secundus]
MAATAWVIASLSACRVVGRCLYTCAFKCPQRKNHKVINRVTLGARRCLLTKREDVQETTLSELLKNAAKCELWLRLVGTRLVPLHGPQQTGLT